MEKQQETCPHYRVQTLEVRHLAARVRDYLRGSVPVQRASPLKRGEASLRRRMARQGDLPVAVHGDGQMSALVWLTRAITQDGKRCDSYGPGASPGAVS